MRISCLLCILFAGCCASPALVPSAGSEKGGGNPPISRALSKVGVKGGGWKNNRQSSSNTSKFRPIWPTRQVTAIGNPHSTEVRLASIGDKAIGEPSKEVSATMSGNDLYRSRIIEYLRNNGGSSNVGTLGSRVPPPGGIRIKGALRQLLMANPDYFKLTEERTGEFWVCLEMKSATTNPFAPGPQSRENALEIKPDGVNKTTTSGDGNKDGSRGYVLVDTAEKMSELLLSHPTFTAGDPELRPEITSLENTLNHLQLNPELTGHDSSSMMRTVDPRSIVSVDCEFTQKRQDPDSAISAAWNPTVVVDELSLIQVATSNGTYIFDCVALPAKDVCDFLRPLLCSSRHIKLFHDIHKDAHCLHAHGGIDSMVCLLDTQLAAEHLWGGMLCGLSEFLGKLDLPAHPLKEDMKRKQNSSPDYWMKRPLDVSSMEYAADDVELLLKAGPLLLEQLGADLDAVISASEKRARASIRGDFGRSICFDPSRKYALASQELLSSTNREAYEIQPMKVECEAPDLINLLPPDLRTKFEVSDDDDDDDDDGDGDGPSSQHPGQNISAEWLPPSLNLEQAEKDQDGYADALESENCLKSPPRSPPSRIIGRSCIPKSGLRDVVLDIGRRPLCYDVSCCRHMLSDSKDRVVTIEDIEHVTSKIGGFGSDKRAALDGKLHRISALQHREGQVVGLTMRCGRYVQGNADMIMDLLLGTDKNILFLGEPGSGKTTIIREAARILAERKAVMLVDTSNEIAGDGNVPHSCIGDARRMMVPSLEDQHQVMIECVQNHTPQIMIVDEIGRPKEVAAVRTVKQRGVRVVGSAHGSLESLISNAELNGLVGGKTTVTIGDEMAKELQRSGKPASKLQTKRAGQATFEVVVEVKSGSHNQWRVILDSEHAVDSILDGRQYKAQVRTRDPATGRVSMELIQVQRSTSNSATASK